MQKFELRLKNEKIPTYNRISWIIVVANILGLAACAVYFPEPRDKFYSTVALALIFLLLFLRFYFKKISRSLGFHGFFVVFMLVWILLGLYWVAGVVLLFAILHTISTRD